MDSLPANTLHCTQCGGELHPDEGQIFLSCPYCASTVYIDKSQVVFHWYLAPTFDDARARASLARWMAGNQTVKDLDKKSRVVSQSFAYFPIWYFKARSNGKDLVFVEPASATSITEIHNLKLPAGDLRKYNQDIESQSHQPSVPLPSALNWLSQRSGGSQVIEQALVHIPVYTMKYQYKGEIFTAIVEAATGAVFANVYPAKAEAPYLLAGAITGGVYLALAAVPLVGFAVGGTSGAGIGLGICAGLGLLAAPVLFAISAWVAARV